MSDPRDPWDLSYWWTCPHCGDRMATTTDRAEVERDQAAHIANAHRWDYWERIELLISHWKATP